MARGALLGLAGGLVAAGAMSVGHRLGGDPAPTAKNPASAKEADATVKVASAVTRSVGYGLTENQKPAAGSVVHYAFGGSVGALYGAFAQVVPSISWMVGLPFGLAIWLGAHVVAVPALGLAEPATRRPLRQEAQELGLHGVYGVTAELVRRLLARII